MKSVVLFGLVTKISSCRSGILDLMRSLQQLLCIHCRQLFPACSCLQSTPACPSAARLTCGFLADSSAIRFFSTSFTEMQPWYCGRGEMAW